MKLLRTCLWGLALYAVASLGLPALAGVYGEPVYVATTGTPVYLTGGTAPFSWTGLSPGTQVSCLGLDSSNNVVTAACGGGGTGTPGGSTNSLQYNAGGGNFGGLALGTDGQLPVGRTGNFPLYVTVSGDATFSVGGAVTLASVISAAGPIGDATHVPAITFDAKGRLTTVTSVAITQPLAANPSQTVDGSVHNGSATTFMRSDGAPALAATAVTPGSYTNTNLTVDQQGRITAASNGSASGSGVGVANAQNIQGYGDVNQTLAGSKYYYHTTAALTTTRTWTLPTSSTGCDGTAAHVCDLEFVDDFATGGVLGAITSANTLTFTTGGTDKLNGVTNGTLVLNVAGSAIGIHNDGAGNYTVTYSSLVPGFSANKVLATNGSSVPAWVTALPSVITATTQAATDNSTLVATDAYVTTAIANAIAAVNPAVAVVAATTQASDTSSYVYANGVSGIGATLTGPTNNVAVTLDGITLTAVGQRVLVKDDTQSPSGAFDGIYTLTILQGVANKPVLTRALDYDSSSDINNTGAIPVTSGTVNALTSWLLTSSVTTVGTDPLTYSKFSINPATPTRLTTGTSVSLAGPRAYFVCTSTCTVTPPVPVAGYEFCVMNDDNVATVITLAALGSSARYEATARTSYGTAGTGTFVSGGAAGDKVCIVGRDSTHYLTTSFNGSWTAN